MRERLVVFSKGDREEEKVSRMTASFVIYSANSLLSPTILELTRFEEC